MNSFAKQSFSRIHNLVPFTRVVCGILLVAAVGLSACSSRENKQTLVRVNGEEITLLQINDELSRAGVKPDQQKAATGDVLESLIGRQLIIDEAMRNKIDRTPEVMHAIEHAKMEIIAKAYLEGVASKLAKPSMNEICDFFQNHPEYFAERKEFVIQQLVIANKDISGELKSIIDSANSLDVVVAWLNRQNIRYVRGQLSRSTADLPEQMVTKLNGIKKGQLFIVHEGENSLLNSISDVRHSPVTAKNAAPQIEKYLINKKNKEAADTEIARLRSIAKIEYLNSPVPNVPQRQIVGVNANPF